MVAVAGLAMCFAANAATYTWNAIATAVMDGSSLASCTMYAFDGSVYTSADVATQLSTLGADILGSALDDVTVANGFFSGTLGGTANTASGISADSSSKLNLFAVLLDSTGENFAMITTSPKDLNPSIESGSPASFSLGMVTIADNQWQAVAVPEPTSGLLLLLGVAGLALKRRRA